MMSGPPSDSGAPTAPGRGRPTLHVGGSTEPEETVVISVSGGTILEYELSDAAQDPALTDGSRIEARFPSYGTYNVTAYVDDGSGTGESVDAILSKPVCIAPRPRLNISPSGTVSTGTPVTFDAGASAGEAAGYEWTIDGPEAARGTGKTLSVSFSAPGDYSATLDVEGRNGAVARTRAGFTVAATVST